MSESQNATSHTTHEGISYAARERDALRAEVESLRAVVEAAETVAETYRGSVAIDALRDALDAYRAGAPEAVDDE